MVHVQCPGSGDPYMYINLQYVIREVDYKAIAGRETVGRASGQVTLLSEESTQTSDYLQHAVCTIM